MLRTTITPSSFSGRSLFTASIVATTLLAAVAQVGFAQTQTKPETPSAAAATKSIESQFLSGVRQLTFEGSASGEGYYNHDGSLLVFQSKRQVDNPFYQIYLLDFETGDVDRVSPGHGKTTCAWIHPDDNRVLFASTQDDPAARDKQKTELEFLESGKERRYSWDYDPTYELYAFDRSTQKYTQLTNAKGYDAEGSYSPDGKLIAFASNRNAYSRKLTDDEQKKFDTDPAIEMEIFIANADGSNVRQLTNTVGYDGGPFFSPDGKRICWRRFTENGLIAEIMTMNLDGSDQKQLTRLNAMSWAPFYHPSGKYLIFTTNKHGFGNFELYIVAADGGSPPVRVSDTDGFDGLASFSPDGKTLTWTSNRNARKESQIYLARWNHDVALKRLAADRVDTTADAAISSATKQGHQSAKSASSGFDQRDLVRHVDYLCRKELGGRMTGSIGERKATAYVAAYMDYLKLNPAGDNGSWYQQFDFPDGAKMGEGNRMTIQAGEKSVADLNIDEDWRPLTFSASTSVDATPVVFAGYGIVAPASENETAYDSYGDLDVKNKWVLVFRFVPEDVSPERRQHLQFHAGLRKKAFQARQRGAAGLIVVSGPTSQVRNQLVPLVNDFSPNGSSIPAISVTDAVAQSLLAGSQRELAELQTQLDDGEINPGFDLAGTTIAASTEVIQKRGVGRNVLGRLQAGDIPSNEFFIVGAHIDHLGSGKTGGSLAKEAEQGSVHVGADDNASGVAAMLEIAEYLAQQKSAGKLRLKRDIVFAGWSGEELGLHGSKHFANQFKSSLEEPKGTGPKDPHEFKLRLTAGKEIFLNDEPTTLEEIEGNLAFIGKLDPKFAIEIEAEGNVKTGRVEKLKQLIRDHGIDGPLTIKVVEGKLENSAGAPSEKRIVACLNMDMVGRFKEKLVLQGIGSSDYWAGAIERRNAVVGLPLTLSDDTDLPTDASSFYRAGVPILSAFTGSHTDYHTPRDTPEKLNYAKATEIAKLMGLIARQLATDEQTPSFIKQDAKPKKAARSRGRAYLGTIPNYGDDVVGVKLEDVTTGAPAALAGVIGGDIIIGLAGQKIENIYDYTAVIDGLKIGQETKIRVKRGEQELELNITPQSRQ